jgi:hypothetical protein
VSQQDCQSPGCDSSLLFPFTTTSLSCMSYNDPKPLGSFPQLQTHGPKPSSLACPLHSHTLKVALYYTSWPLGQSSSLLRGIFKKHSSELVILYSSPTMTSMTWSPAFSGHWLCCSPCPALGCRYTGLLPWDSCTC